MRIGGPGQPIGSRANELPRYQRPPEALRVAAIASGELVPFAACETVLATSSLSQGTRQLLHGLLRLGTTRVFPGGGAGLEYGGLLKTAVRPDYLAPHVREAAHHLQEARANLLVVPGMSGYPIGVMYATVAGLPAVLLNKTRLDENETDDFPAGSFIIPSYTGDGDVVISADREAVQDIVDTIASEQLASQHEASEPILALRIAGADDIIDKATMSQAVGDSTLVLGKAALAEFVRRHRLATGDPRPIEQRVELVAFVTPLLKVYNHPGERLMRAYGVTPFTGLAITSLHLDPPAIGVAGAGVFAFARRASGVED